jgi:predicted exporter
VLSLAVSLALFAVIALSLAAGVGLGYAIIFGILHLFDRSRYSIKAAPARLFDSTAGGN